jgi:hypothetical protein
MVSGPMLKKRQMLMWSARDLMVARKLTWSGQDLQPDRRLVDRRLVLMAGRRLIPESLIQMRMGYWRLVVRTDLSLGLPVQKPPLSCPVGLDAHLRLLQCTGRHLRHHL